MFRITDDPSSVSLVQCLAKNYKNDSILSVDMDNVSVMAAYAAITLQHVSDHRRSIISEPCTVLC